MLNTAAGILYKHYPAGTVIFVISLAVGVLHAVGYGLRVLYLTYSLVVVHILDVAALAYLGKVWRGLGQYVTYSVISICGLAGVWVVN